jgi:two-component system chemotaxis response regulator CheB
VFNNDPIVVIGCSHGCVAALQHLALAFDPQWRTSIFITIHIGCQESSLPQLLGRNCRMLVSHAKDLELIERGRVYIAPPDRHLCIEQTYMRLSHGPRENWTRPAIDPMFRSAARSHDSGVIGILLTGHLYDGVNGLHAIHGSGGCTIVQDPSDAVSPDMPRNALSRMQPDYVRRLRDIPGAITDCLVEMSDLPKRVGGTHG